MGWRGGRGWGGEVGGVGVARWEGWSSGGGGLDGGLDGGSGVGGGGGRRAGGRAGGVKGGRQGVCGREAGLSLSTLSLSLLSLSLLYSLSTSRMIFLTCDAGARVLPHSAAKGTLDRWAVRVQWWRAPRSSRAAPRAMRRQHTPPEAPYPRPPAAAPLRGCSAARPAATVAARPWGAARPRAAAWARMRTLGGRGRGWARPGFAPYPSPREPCEGGPQRSAARRWPARRRPSKGAG